MAIISQLGTGLYSQEALECLKSLFKYDSSASIDQDYFGEIIFGVTDIYKTKLEKIHTRADLARWINYEWSLRLPKLERKKTDFVSDFLRGLSKKTLVSRYGEDFFKLMVGAPRDPFTAEKIKLKEEEAAKLREHYEKLKREAQEEAVALKSSIDLQLRKKTSSLSRELKREAYEEAAHLMQEITSKLSKRLREISHELGLKLSELEAEFKKIGQNSLDMSN